jgi:thiol-disulfide isomerase/thioredoxin
MRFILSSFFALLVVATCGCSAMSDKGKEMIGNEAPEARLMFFNGSEVPLSSYRGKNVCIVFWATWCTYSRSLIERYEDLARHYGRRSDMEFIAVSIDKNEDFEVLKARIQEQNLKSMTHIFSGNDSYDDAFVNLKGKNIPYVVFIDRNGVVRLTDHDIAPLEQYLSMEFGLH